MSEADNKVEDDLEEGEIKDDAFEDISECSLSDILIMQQDLKDDSDVDQLREEALKSLRDADNEVTEEELYRLEALKSLLKNIESSEKKPEKETEKKKRKRKRKTKQNTLSKSFKAENKPSDKLELPSEPSHEHLSNLKIDIDVKFLNKENLIINDSKSITRSWYPKHDSVLLNPRVENLKEEKKLPKPENNDDFILVSKILSVADTDVKPAVVNPVYVKKPGSYRTTNLRKPVAAPISKPIRLMPLTSISNSRFKNISKHHIRKYDSVSAPINRFSLRNIKKGKYKLVNSSRYVLKKTVNPNPVKTVMSNSVRKSIYSINRVKNQPPRLTSSEFIIKLDEEDSGNENELPKSPRIQEVLKKTSLKMNDLKVSPTNRSPNNSVSSVMLRNGNVIQVCPQKCNSTADISSPSVDSNLKVVAKTPPTDTTNVFPSDFKLHKSVSCSVVTASPSQPPCDTRSPSVTVKNEKPNICTDDEESSFDESAISETTSYADEKCDINLIIQFDALAENENSSEMVPYNMKNCDIDLTFLKTEPKPDVEESIQPSSCTEEENSLDETSIPRTSFCVNSKCDTDLIAQLNACSEPENSINERSMSTAVPFDVKKSNTKQTIQETKPKSNNNAETVDATRNACNSKVVKTSSDDDNLFVLVDAEANLVKIRARLLCNLGELESSIKKQQSENEKLTSMLRKILTLKSLIFKFEDKIKLQKSKLSTNLNSVHSLLKDVTVRTDTCAQLKDVCIRAGVEIIGPEYKPPETYESLIAEKCKAIDFSKYVPSNFK